MPTPTLAAHSESALRSAAGLSLRDGQKVLVAVDRLAHAALIHDILDRLDARGMYVRTAREARALCRTERFDAIILSEAAGGLTESAAIRALGGWRDTVPIVCLAHGSKLTQYGSLCEAGITLLLPEPVSAAQLAAALVGVLSLDSVSPGFAAASGAPRAVFRTGRLG